MTNEELNNALFEKMQAEQDAYRGWLLQQPPEAILDHTYVFTVRMDILTAVENSSLSDDQAAALLKSKTPLADVYKDFTKVDTGYMDMIRDTLENRADTEIQKEQERRTALRNLPIYPYPATYAREHGELEQYRESHRANIACTEAIAAAISAHYQNNHLDRAAVMEVAERFGYDRMLFVLANTVRQKDWDERFSRGNREWAQKYRVSGAVDFSDIGRETDYIVNSHSVLTDAFLSTARREYLLSLPLTAPEIRAEAQRLLEKLQAPTEPNSPHRTNFMAEISPDFMARASSRDTEALQKFLPFKSLALTTMKDRKGVFAVIAKDEDRNKKLRTPRASVLEKLQRPLPETSPNISAKSREAER